MWLALAMTSYFYDDTTTVCPTFGGGECESSQKHAQNTLRIWGNLMLETAKLSALSCIRHGSLRVSGHREKSQNSSRGRGRCPAIPGRRASTSPSPCGACCPHPAQVIGADLPSLTCMWLYSKHIHAKFPSRPPDTPSWRVEALSIQFPSHACIFHLDMHMHHRPTSSDFNEAPPPPPPPGACGFTNQPSYMPTLREPWQIMPSLVNRHDKTKPDTAASGRSKPMARRTPSSPANETTLLTKAPDTIVNLISLTCLSRSCEPESGGLMLPSPRALRSTAAKSMPMKRHRTLHGSACTFLMSAEPPPPPPRPLGPSVTPSPPNRLPTHPLEML